MKDPFLKHCFQFAVQVDYNDEISIIAKIGSIIGDKSMQAGVDILSVDVFDCIRTTYFTERVGVEAYDTVDAYPTPLWTVMDDEDLSFTMDSILYDGRVVEYNKNRKLISSDLDKVLQLMSESLSKEDYQKFCRDLRIECDGDINDNLLTVDCKIEKKAVKRVDFKSKVFKYSIYLLNSDEGVIVAYDKLPGLCYEKKISKSKDIQNPLRDALEGMTYEEIKQLRKDIKSIK